MKTFSQPLTASEEAYYLRLLKEGSGEEAMRARNILIERNLRLVAHIAKKYQNVDEDMEDLISIGTIGLIKAISSFDAVRGKLSTYASRCIENEILMFLRKSSQYKNELSIDEPLNIDWDGNELLLSDILGTDEDIVNGNIESEAEKSVLLQAVENLPERERCIMKMRFGIPNGNEMTQKEVADIIGISQSYISRLEKRIIKKLKRDLEKVMN